MMSLNTSRPSYCAFAYRKIQSYGLPAYMELKPLSLRGWLINALHLSPALSISSFTKKERHLAAPPRLEKTINPSGKTSYLLVNFYHMRSICFDLLLVFLWKFKSKDTVLVACIDIILSDLIAYIEAPAHRACFTILEQFSSVISRLSHRPYPASAP